MATVARGQVDREAEFVSVELASARAAVEQSRIESAVSKFEYEEKQKIHLRDLQRLREAELEDGCLRGQQLELDLERKRAELSAVAQQCDWFGSEMRRLQSSIQILKNVPLPEFAGRKQCEAHQAKIDRLEDEYAAVLADPERIEITGRRTKLQQEINLLNVQIAGLTRWIGNQRVIVAGRKLGHF